ncbi:MAG: nucleotide exchange factor GrpE [Oscillospiraceae bacterium]|jgi:molecular chaperone GrpE|nr:nucleotide exchange factor GrpE [Oscillospiraceae bacterium]
MAKAKKEPAEELETSVPEASEDAASEAEAWKDAALRAQADLVNFRNRTQRERESLWGEVRADTLTALLPVLDNLERALEAPCSDECYKQGVELTLRQFLEILSKLGVAEIEAMGKPFDPQRMDAVMHEESDEADESTVTQVFQKGYHIGERILRHAVVKVVN